MSAVEALTRDLSAELAHQGIRVVGLPPQGMPDSDTIKEVFGLHNVAAFMASDEASALTGTVVNLSLGSLDD
jgi:NAD(P)-dependent dehydrogenase (short-subunit alcohol dehydrogenase family)